MNIDKNTKASETMAKYPWLLDELVKVSDKFQFAKTPIGSMMLKNRRPLGRRFFIGLRRGLNPLKIFTRLGAFFP